MPCPAPSASRQMQKPDLGLRVMRIVPPPHPPSAGLWLPVNASYLDLSPKPLSSNSKSTATVAVAGAPAMVYRPAWSASGSRAPYARATRKPGDVRKRK